MLLSSCVVWRYRDLATFREQCPGGDAELQRQVIERLDEGLAWLRGLGAEVVWEETGNPLTVGLRFDPRSLTDVLVARRGRSGSATTRPATRSSSCSRQAASRATATSCASTSTRAASCSFVRTAGAPATGYGSRSRAARRSRAGWTSSTDARCPPRRRWSPRRDFVSLAQLYGRHALVLDERRRGVRARSDFLVGDGSRAGDRATAERERVVSRRRGRARGRAPRTHGARHGRGRARGGRRGRCCRTSSASRCPLRTATPCTSRRRSRTRSAGVRIDTQARVLREDGTPIDGLYAAGADAGGIATGGYASGLASALVFGRIAAETARPQRDQLCRYAQTRRSSGSGDGATFTTVHCLPSASTVVADFRQRRRSPRGARSPPASSERPGTSAHCCSSARILLARPASEAAPARSSCPPTLVDRHATVRAFARAPRACRRTRRRRSS